MISTVRPEAVLGDGPVAQPLPLRDGWLVMAGTLEAPDRCGKRYLLACSEGHYFKMGADSSCYSPTCSTCWNKWKLTRGAAMALRIQAYIDRHGGLAEVGPGGLYVHHVKVSPPQDRPIGELSDISMLRAEAWEIVERKGALGGCAVFHPWRGDWVRGWEWGPHFHFLVLSTRKWLDRGGKLEDGGWVVKNRRLSKGGLRERYLKGGARERAVMHGILETARYELDHAGVGITGALRARHTATWYGALSYRNFELSDADRELDSRLKGASRVACPYCGTHEVEAVVDPYEVAIGHAWMREREIEAEGGFDLVAA